MAPSNSDSRSTKSIIESAPNSICSIGSSLWASCPPHTPSKIPTLRKPRRLRHPRGPPLFLPAIRRRQCLRRLRGLVADSPHFREQLRHAHPRECLEERG